MEEQSVYVSLAFTDEPAWPSEPGPYLFLLEVSGPLERKLLEAWITRNRPDDVDPGDVQIAMLPLTRRKRRDLDPRLDAFLAGDDDTLLMPLRVAWLAPDRAGARTVGLRDLLTFGDPRDPDPVRQHFIFRTRPDRVRILTTDGVRASDARDAWSQPDSRRDGRSFAEYVALRSWRELERAERRLRGSRYKVPKFPIQTLTERTTYTRGVASLARTSGVPYQVMAIRTRRYVREIAATHSPYVIDLVTGGIRWLLNKAYVDLHYDKEELAALYTLSQQYPLVFLPSHKSNMDHLVLEYVLYQNDLPPNHTAGGINMNFFPVGPFLRRSGVFFIRRQFKDNQPYKFVLRQYLDYLLERRFPLEWYIEGGRSRSGKLRPPRVGLLAYVVESFLRGSADDVIFIPVSIAYDQITDVDSYAAEQTGGGKESESFGWMFDTIRKVRRRYGDVHVRFGAPIPLRTYLADNEGDDSVDPDDSHNPLIPKLAFEISVRLNEATPITPISLTALALLAEDDRSMSVDETIEKLRPYVEIITRRDLPMTVKIDPGNRNQIHRALEDLATHGVVSRYDGGTETVYRIGPEQHLAAAYYRNTIVHFFVTAAITELALIAVDTEGSSDPTRAVIEEALALRDLLKFEFFFAPSDEFADQVRTELADHDPDWRAHLAAGDVRDVLLTFTPFQSPAVLRPFVDAYTVVGDLIEQHAYEAVIDTDKLLGEALTLGKQHLLQGRVATADSVAKVLFEAAISLANNRKLFSQGPDMVERRLAFAAELRTVDARIETARAFRVGKDAGIF